MKITAEKDEQSQYIVRIEIEPSELEDAKGRAAKNLSNRVRVPGFRPGKAPRALVERIVGPEAIAEEATRILFPKAYKEAIDTNQIKAIGDPEMEIESNDPLTIKATIPVEPTVILGDYKSIQKELVIPEVTEQEIEEVINNLRDQQSTWEEPETERPAQDGDRVEIDMLTIKDGEPSGEPVNRTGVLGKGELLSQIEAQIPGMAIGEEKTIEIERQKPAVAPTEEGAEAEETPEDAEAETPLVFKVTLKSIKVKNEPALDDAFAASVSDVQTFDELKERILSNQKSQKESDAKRKLVDTLIEEAVALSVVQVPPILVHSQIGMLEEDLANRLKQQKLSLDQYLAIMGKSHEDFHEELRPQAITRLNTALVLREIATAEGVAVSGEETDREVENMVNEYSVGAPEEQKEEQRKRLRDIFNQKEMRENLSENLFSRKLADRLIEISTGIQVVAESVSDAQAAVGTEELKSEVIEAETES
ncbi:MAG: trigger factor [Chloroflexi bacterium]|uniref:Trigger factor n=1 Tax=Candidatus Chlorohelix allophototropha TaxID=3003348 RepID=A0A8T7LV66_9CHLR|nr:trigger factor [Chloroflexota bacterium]WJW66631.1 trigger factor [Chloroflexota bacterium L227-S17]